MLKDMEADAQKLLSADLAPVCRPSMTPAQYDSTTLTRAAGDFKLKARGRTLRFRRLDKSHAGAAQGR
ncbi:hypothetical protein MJ699_13115 [Klebsiella pneumoniae]|nr:hypothetical protein MJ699_13115 [Klebsiella pneumoniae]